MKIAVISHWGFKSLHGGNLRFYFLIKELIRRGHALTIVLADNMDIQHCIELFGCRAISVNEPMSRWQSMRSKMLQYSVFAYKVKKCLDSHGFDTVMGINLIQALPAVWHDKEKAMIMYVDLWADFYEYDSKKTLLNKLIARTVRFVEFHTIRKAKKVIIITEAMKQLIPKKTRDKVKVIPDGADTKHFRPGLDGSKIRDQYGLGNAPVFSYQGGIAPHEGLNFLCMAAPYVLREIPGAKFLIVGKGDFLKVCQNIVRTNGTEKSFVFTGWIDYAHMNSVLAAVDVSVVPMPNVRASRPIISFKLLEGMASKTLIVANRLPGLCEIVDDSMVLMTNVEDPLIFAKDLVTAYQMPESKKQEMSTKALEKIRSLDWRLIAKKDADYFTN